MWKNSKNIRKVIIIALGIFTLIFLFAVVFNLILKVERDSIDNPIHISAVSLNDYHLISEKYSDKLKEGISYQSNNRNPVTVFHFDNKYRLISYKIDFTRNISLNNALALTIKNVDRSNNEVYTVISKDLPFRFQYHNVQIMPVSKIYLTLSGDSLQNVQQNDSIISHYLICSNMSIRYKVKEPLDIFLVGPDRALGTTATFPMDLLLLKKGSAVYLMIMTPDTSQRTIAPDLLYNIVTGR